MARARRRANARTRLNLEIVGITAIALAVLCGIALAFPHHAGSDRRLDCRRRCAGSSEPRRRSFPVLVALFGAIVFLEVNVPRMIAGLGSTRACVLPHHRRDVRRAAVSTRGGIVGSNIWWALRALVGDAGAWILLVARRALADAVADQREPEADDRRASSSSSAACDRRRCRSFRTALRFPRGHASLREAFALPMRRSDAAPAGARRRGRTSAKSAHVVKTAGQVAVVEVCAAGDESRDRVDEPK